ncbi:uncharacterized protein HMPREF1541_07326 [Cyphellophora europaea CBS 101466]|uniref:Major facilitator superfamily (MFS) profile domain-containing protein n=1 Tax=Cyphellophora europaea (strain CBS 101466) TaxID=1220924 RepID=W2RPR8_CYPE1|nr:uncharacterized protein HMPREF1541_07326 [Cyphellophora europaea CBS 101466]ETN37703.1 hypothetical protein HMPREF1541_07326 [Cyphellophora europaea CBS 101466]
MTEIATSLADWPYAWAYFFPVMLLSIAIGTFTPAAHSILEQGGFPQPRHQPLNVYVYLFAGCQSAVGLSVAVLEALGDWKAVGVILGCLTPMALLSTSLSAVKGGTGLGSAFWTHGVMTVIGTRAAWRLVQEHW